MSRTTRCPGLDDMLNAVEHANFFENRSTEYSRASTGGTWEEAFSDGVFEQKQPSGAIEFGASSEA